MKTDTSEKGLEALIVAHMTGHHVAARERGGLAEEPEPFVRLDGWIFGDSRDYDRTWTVDLAQLRAFLAATQPPLLTALDLDSNSPTRQKFLARLQGEIGKRGIIDVLRRGLRKQIQSLGEILLQICCRRSGERFSTQSWIVAGSAASAISARGFAATLRSRARVLLRYWIATLTTKIGCHLL